MQNTVTKLFNIQYPIVQAGMVWNSGWKLASASSNAGILGLIGVGINEFAVAGSFVLFFMALEMILGIEIFRDNGEGTTKVASVVPLAFPMIAGAGTMTSLISLRAEF